MIVMGVWRHDGSELSLCRELHITCTAPVVPVAVHLMFDAAAQWVVQLVQMISEATVTPTSRCTALPAECTARDISKKNPICTNTSLMLKGLIMLYTSDVCTKCTRGPYTLRVF